MILAHYIVRSLGTELLIIILFVVGVVRHTHLPGRSHTRNVSAPPLVVRREGYLEAEAHVELGLRCLLCIKSGGTMPEMADHLVFQPHIPEQELLKAE